MVVTISHLDLNDKVGILNIYFLEHFYNHEHVNVDLAPCTKRSERLASKQ